MDGIKPFLVLGGMAIAVTIFLYSAWFVIPSFADTMIRSMPNTSPDLKTPTSVLDAKDSVDSAQNILSLFENIFKQAK